MPTILIIGAGLNVGLATAELFSKAGYTVAIASRSNKFDSKFKHFPFDAGKPDAVPTLFAQVTAALGTPSVVVYNAYTNHKTQPNAPFDTSLTTFNDVINVNTTTVWATAHAATDAWLADPSALSDAEGGSFIFTGNLFNETVTPGLLAFGLAKAASAHLIQHLALLSFEGQPYKFYYVDERESNGVPMWMGPNGAAHAETFLELAKDPAQRAWQYTFVRGEGYKKFEPVPFMKE